MQTKTICPHCSQKLRVDSEKRGKTVGCPACGQSFLFESSGDISLLSLGKQANQTVEATDGSALGSMAKTAERSDRTKRPRKLGRFEIVSILGTGGFGKVYKAHDPSLDRFIALKVPIFVSSGETRIKRFAAEAKAAARLRHPNIVTTYESGKAGERYYIATEYIEGELLSDRLQRDSLSFSKAVEIVRKLALALGYAHSSGIIHRDLKPHNVMLDGNGEPQLMDFGLARRTDDDSNLTTDGSLLGTPAYMSPEQARGEIENVDALSDQYSLGVVLYYLLTGSVPHEGAPYVIVSKVAMGNHHPVRERNAEVDPTLDAICQKAMMPDRERRYQSCEEFASDLLAWSESRPVLARPMTRLQTWGHHVRRYRVAVAAALCVATATIAAGLFAFSNVPPFATALNEDATVVSELEPKTIDSAGAEESRVDPPFASEAQTENNVSTSIVPPTEDVDASMGVQDIAATAQDIIFADFEDGSYGDWRKEGFAFGNTPRNAFVTASRGGFAHHPWPMNGNFVADSYYAENGVGLGKFVGKLISPSFQINRRFINFLGAAHVEYVRVVVNGNVIQTGKRDINVPFDRISPVILDVGEYLGQTATIEIIDDGTGDHDHVIADCFVLSDSDLHDKWQEKCIEETQDEAIELVGRRYYFGPIPVTFENAKDLAEVIGGRLLTVESEDEATALVPHLKDASWQGVRKEGGIWQNEDGDIYTHVDWGGHSTKGVPGYQEENTLLTLDGHYQHVSGGFRFPVIEFGPQQKPPTYQLTAPQQNRQLAQYLIDSRATMIIATAERFRYDWYHNDIGTNPLPDEAFEVQYVSLPEGFLVNEEVERLFEFDNRIRHLGIKKGNDDSLKVIPHLKHLRSLTIDRGDYVSWSGLSEMERGHPLARFDLRYVKFDADQISPLFRAKGLQQALFYALRLSPEIGSLLAAHSDSLVEFSANGSFGLGRRGFEEFGKLKRLRSAQLYGSDLRDEDLQHIGQLTSLRNINMGGNKRITGSSLHELAGWVNLTNLAVFSLMDDGKLAKLPPLPSLRKIDMTDADVSGASLAWLCQFPSLEEIGLNGTLVDNAALQQLLTCTRLRRLDVKDTKVTPDGLRAFFARIPGFSADVD